MDVVDNNLRSGICQAVHVLARISTVVAHEASYFNEWANRSDEIGSKFPIVRDAKTDDCICDWTLKGGQSTWWHANLSLLLLYPARHLGRLFVAGA